MTAPHLHWPAERGFTLVEMLVALTVFALLAAAGVGILRSSVDTQAAVDQRLGAVASAGRLHALLTGDLGQVVDRPSRGPGGQRPAFDGNSSSMQFVRAGWSNPDGAPRPDLQRVEWRLDQAELVRIGHARIDGTDGNQPAVFARDVAALALRYRMPGGDWQSAFQSTAELPLPTAVEMTLTGRDAPPMTIIFALPQTGKSPTGVPASATNGVPA